MNLRETILAAADRASVPVVVPEWGVTVFVRPLSLGGSMAVFDAATATRRAVLLLLHGTCDADGKPLFTEEDATALLDKSAPACSRVLEQINKLGEHGGMAAAGEGSGATAGSATSTL